jgi:hypothetical protein
MDKNKKSDCCGAPCDFASSWFGGKCWGGVGVVDEELLYDEDGEISDYRWVHACEGHCDMSYGGDYKKEQK